MFIELIDHLRCPVEHEESWLVAAFTRMDGRFVIEGKLGCPVCAASYRIIDGRAVFGEAGPLPAAATDPRGEDEAVRYAAMLGLSRPGALVVIRGSAAAHSGSIAVMTDTRVIAVNPPPGVTEFELVGIVESGTRIPVATASIDGAVLDGPPDWQETARILKPGGRLVADASGEHDPRFREIARDERHLVAEFIGALIPLRR